MDPGSQDGSGCPPMAAEAAGHRLTTFAVAAMEQWEFVAYSVGGRDDLYVRQYFEDQIASSITLYKVRES